MQKNTKHKNINKQNIIIGLVAAVALITSGISLYTLQLLHTTVDDDVSMTAKLQIADARLRFCHDEQIVPCDDTAIEAWNEKHPGKEFNILR